VTIQSHITPKSSTFEAEKILRSIMLRDRVVLRRRGECDEPLTPRVLSDETREKLRDAGRRRQQIHKQKSQPAIVSPIASRRRTAHA
jgi:hypothetical protein